MEVSIERATGDRGGYQLRTELLLAEPRQQVFEFFADAFELERITPPWLHFSVTTPAPIAMQTGALIDYRLRLHGVPLRWRTKISEWEPPYRFVDEQLRGPYRFWRHLHTFDEVEEGTLVRDVVDYDFPLGLILHPLLVRRDLQQIFTYRRDEMSKIFTPVQRQLAAT